MKISNKANSRFTISSFHKDIWQNFSVPCTYFQKRKQIELRAKQKKDLEFFEVLLAIIIYENYYFYHHLFSLSIIFHTPFYNTESIAYFLIKKQTTKTYEEKAEYYARFSFPNFL